MNNLNLQTLLNGVCTSFLGNVVKRSALANSLDLYLRFVLSSFRRLFYTLIVCLKLSCGLYLSLIFYVFKLNDALTFVSPSQYNVAVMFGQCMKLILMLKRNVVNASIGSLIVNTISETSMHVLLDLHGYVL